MTLDPTTATTADFDPLSIEDVPTGILRVRNQAGAPTPMAITLAGPEHPDRKKRLFGRQRRLRAVLSKTGKLPMSDPEDDESDELDDLVACTLGWTGCTMPYSPQAARNIYADPKRQWLRGQVKAALEERELFTHSSVAS